MTHTDEPVDPVDPVDPIDPARIEEYVETALVLGGYRFDAERRQSIAAEFTRIAAIAADFLEEAPPIEREPLAQFRP